MRRFRRYVDIGLPILGTIIVLGGALLLFDLYARMATVLFGVFLIEAGVWKLAHPLLPSQRRYQALRDEVDGFIKLVRRLNTAALQVKSGDAAAQPSFESARSDMLASIDRMSMYAGDPDATRPAESAAATR